MTCAIRPCCSSALLLGSNCARVVLRNAVVTSSATVGRRRAGSDPIPRLTVPEKLVASFPRSWQPYLRLMRVHKPAGIWTLYWPCTWSIGLAASAGSLPDVRMLGLFLLGSFTMRSAGCVINDLFDKDIDRMVERTKVRPLASGELSSMQAMWLLSGLLSVSLGVLLQLDWYSVAIGASSMALVVSYPLAKRYTYWPQLVLGLAVNWGVLVSWAAAAGAPLVGAAPLYAACVLHTLFYDTVYSHQDKTDDLIAGVKSTALLFGDRTKAYLSVFAAGMVGGLTITGYSCAQTWPYYAGVAFVASHLIWQIKTLNINSASNCWDRFVSNRAIGVALLLAIVAGNLLKEEQSHRSQNSQIDES